MNNVIQHIVYRHKKCTKHAYIDNLDNLSKNDILNKFKIYLESNEPLTDYFFIKNNTIYPKDNTIYQKDNGDIETYKDGMLFIKFIIFIPYCDIYKDFIIECLESVERQNYNNYEVIIVNDGAKDTKIINEYISNKSNYKIIHRENNEGPAASKFTFLSYIKENIYNYNANDIVAILDGDDYLMNNNALKIINNTYLKTKCWVSCSNFEGKFNHNIINKMINCKKNKINLRENFIGFPHIRTFKLGLINHMDLTRFKIEGKFITKCSDQPIIFQIIELSTWDKVEIIPEKLYFYREHNLNSYKTVSKQDKEKYINYLKKLKPLKQLVNKIDLILLTYNRNEGLQDIFEFLRKQTFKNFRLHLISNNENNIQNEYIYNLISKFKDIDIEFIKNNYNYHTYGKIIYTKYLYKHYISDYIVIFDDDQIYDETWLEKLITYKTPLSVSSWYGKNFNEVYYWYSTIRYTDIIKGQYKDVKLFKYFGSGGCIIDLSLFLYNEIYNFNNYDLDIIKIDDLWLSFIFNKFLNIIFKRSFITPIRFIETKQTFTNIKDVKQKLFSNFVVDHKWSLDNETPKFITVNSFFDKVYVINLKNDKLKRNKCYEQLNNLNIIFEFFEGHNGHNCDNCKEYISYFKSRPVDDKIYHKNQIKYLDKKKNKFNSFLIRNEGTLGILKSMRRLLEDAKKNNFKKILVLQDDVIFDKKFIFKFDNIIKNIPEKWDILNLGSLQWNNNNIQYSNGYYKSISTTYGAHAQGIKSTMYNILLEKINKLNSSYDTFISSDIYTNNKYNCFTIYPNICIQDITNSTSGMGKRDLIQDTKINNRVYRPNKMWDLENYNYNKYLDIDVFIVLLDNNPVKFNYYNYNIISYEEINNIQDDKYLIILNNISTNYFNTYIITRLLIELKYNNIDICFSKSIPINYYDTKNPELMDIYLPYYNKSESDICSDAIIFKNKNIFFEKKMSFKSKINSGLKFIF